MSLSLPIAAQAVYAAALLIMVAIYILSGPNIAAEQAPMQWRLDGTLTWYAPKALALWASFAIAAPIGAVLVVLARYAPPDGRAAVWWGLVLLSAVILAVHIFHVSAIFRWAG